jgi:methylamine---glutamate N-methyltransferase subunit C
MAIYICSVCGYIYDEAKKEVAWDALPEDWVCPVCDSEKELFDKEE